MSKRLFMLCLMSLFSFFGIRDVAANDGLPDNLQTITVDNASQIQELSSIGGALQGRLVWSPDNQSLAVGTSEEIQVYDSQNLDTPPLLIDANGMNFSFNDAGEIVVDAQRWDSTSGNLIGDVEQDNRIFSPSGNIEVRVNQVNGETEITFISGDDATVSIRTEHEFNDIVFNPDEDFALLLLNSTENDLPYGLVQLWHITDGTFIANLPQALEFTDTATFFADGDLILTTSYTDAVYGGIFNEAVIWDGHTGERLSNNTSPPATFSPDGELLTLLTSNSILLWTTRAIGTLTYPSEDWGGYGLQFSPDSHTIATRRSRAILLWDVSDEQAVPEAPYLNFETEEFINDLLYSPDGSYIASIEQGGIAEVFDAQTGIRQARLSVESGFLYTGVKFSHDGRFLWTRSNNGDAYFLDIENDTTRIVEIPRAAVINNDWTQAAYWEDGIVRIVSLETGDTSDIEVIADYFGEIVGFNPDSGLLFFTGENIRAYDLNSRAIIFEKANPENTYRGLQLSDDSSQILLTNQVSGAIEIWELSNWIEPVTSLMSANSAWSTLIFSPDKHYISEITGACGEGGGSFTLWDAHTGAYLTGYRGTDCGPYDHSFTPDGSWLMIAWDMNLHINNLEEMIARSIDPDAEFVLSTGIYYRNPRYRLRQATLSPDGEWLAVHLIGLSSYESPEAVDPKIDIFHFQDIIASGSSPTDELAIASIPDATEALFSPDSQWLLTDNGFWDAQTGEQLSTVAGTIASFNPDGTVLATYESGQVQLWDVDALLNGSELALFTFDIEGVQELAFNPNGTLLFIKRAGDVGLWGVP